MALCRFLNGAKNPVCCSLQRIPAGTPGHISPLSMTDEDDIMLHGVNNMNLDFDIDREAEEFTRTFSQLMAGQLERRVLTLSKGEFGLMMALSEHGSPMTSTALSDELHIGLSGVANLLSKLEKKGFVHRGTSASDRRANQITITELGRVHLDARFQQVKRSAVLYISAMDPRDVHDFNRILKQLLALSRKTGLPD